jgi:tRNA modification GTPase
MQTLLASGARLADPGEFTYRAFMNGKMDLAQAEAVCDLINARTDEAHRAAIAQHDGRLSLAFNEVRDVLLGVLARIEASIDFPEDVGELDVEHCCQDLDAASRATVALLNTANRGILYREGARVVLAGRPNVGKSSLMNALLRTSRAIVTPIPGTTRDVIEEALNLQGIPVRLMDTAGLRETEDEIERLGVERTHSSVESADLLLIILDASNPLTCEDELILQRAKSRPHIVVFNKIDILSGAFPAPAEALSVSALTGQGIDDLEDAVANRLLIGAAPSTSSAVVTHARHRNALLKARERIDDALTTIATEMPPDFLAIDVRGAIDAIEDVTGRSTGDDIINEIFSRFCIGK